MYRDRTEGQATQDIAVHVSARRLWTFPAIQPVVRAGGESQGEEAVLRPRQAEVLAQRLALVFAAEHAAALQLRHHAFDEVVEPGRAGTGT